MKLTLFFVISVAYLGAFILLVLAGMRYFRSPKREVVHALDSSALKFLAVSDEDKRWVQQKKPLIAAFVDFQCPYCRIQLPALLQWEKLTKGQVRLDIRQFPLSSLHPYAYPASTMFVIKSQPNRLTQPTEVAARLCSLDLPKVMADGTKIDTFLGGAVMEDSAQRARKVVDDDITAGEALGVHATPSFFVVRSNGEIIEAHGLNNLYELCDP